MKNPFKAIIHNRYIAGIIFAAGLALPATYLGNKFPIIGGPIFGIVIGLLLALGTKPEAFDKGVTFTAKYALWGAVFFLGFGVNMTFLLSLAKSSLIIAAFTFAVTLIIGFIAAKLFKADGKTTALIGISAAVGGLLSVEPTAKALNADEKTNKDALSAVTFISLLAAFLFPFIGHISKLTSSVFGTFSGAAVGDLTAAAAAGFAIDNASGFSAVAVNLTRFVFIVPIVLVIALITKSKEKHKGVETAALRFDFLKIFPWFILGFIAASCVVTFTGLPQKVSSYLFDIGKYLLVMGAASIGVHIDLIKILKSGKRKFVLASVFLVATTATVFLVETYLL